MNIKQLITNLKASSLIARCPICDEEFNLSDALLFDGMTKFPKPAEEKRLLLLQELNERKKEHLGYHCTYTQPFFCHSF